ncbi:MAG TPA: hypothetical protein PKY01_15000 [Candidatus Hydrogenedentes bacterium]|nr:hypothetical protein [Candidatus Hydrogenedentota bacterium]
MNKQNRFEQVGIDRLIRLTWLEKTARMALAGMDAKGIEQQLAESLAGEFPTAQNPSTRGSLSKTITILMRTWVRVPPDLRSLRDAGLDILKAKGRGASRPVHWGMLGAVYPFWTSVATQTGRLLRLQGNLGAAEVQRRLKEQYGERELVARRVRYVLRAFHDWDVLRETGRKGVYEQGTIDSVDDDSVGVWMVQAYLNSRRDRSAPLSEVYDDPSLFPFKLKRCVPEILSHRSPQIEIVHYGFDQPFIKLKN